MKATIALLPLLTLVVAGFDRDNMSLKDGDCTSLSLSDKTILQAECTNPALKYTPNDRERMYLTLDRCFANYLGTLNYVPHGNFGNSCKDCHIDNYVLTCQCEIGKGQGTKKTTYNLNNSDVIKLKSNDFNYTMECHGLNDVTSLKRDEKKQARPFFA
ncbi:hypothetical protein F4678DRAFT_485667 [Xylaria arbuscula]|nr:hypothetical protein F4678DRAFT_485667 [Xylaria arbuscula]